MPRVRIRQAAVRAVRHPRLMTRNIVTRPWEVTAILVRAVPGRLRRPVVRPVAAILERLVQRRPGPRPLPELAVLASAALGAGPRTEAMAREVAGRPTTPAASRRAIAILAWEFGLGQASSDIADSLAEDTSPNLEALRAEIAFQGGRYAAAVAHGRAAPGMPRAESAAALAESRLRVLDPDWEPDLGAEAARLSAERRRPTPGRVLHLVSSSLPYRQAGYTLRSQAVALAQRDAGLDPQFATRAGFPRIDGIRHAPALDVIDGVPYHRLAADFQHVGHDDQVVTQTARAAVTLVGRLRPAVLQPVSDFLQPRAALAVGAALEIPVVYEVRGFLEETWASQPKVGSGHDVGDADRYRLRRAAETRAMAAAAAVVTLSNTMRDDIVERGIDADKVVIVPNAVDVDRFQPVPRDDGLAASLGIAPGEVVFGYISSFSGYEGIEYLLEAAAMLRARGRRLHVLLVGDGKERTALELAGQRLHLDDGTLIMPGRVPFDAVQRYYSIIDVFVVPRDASRVSRLVTPLKPYEAMAMERAVVVSDVPALREMVLPDETGRLFRAEDAGHLAEVLAELADDPAARLALGQRARAWVAASRTWAENGRRYRALYERLGAA